MGFYYLEFEFKLGLVFQEKLVIMAFPSFSLEC